MAENEALAERARAAVERLANTRMDMSLEEWGNVSSVILAALASLAPAPDREQKQGFSDPASPSGARERNPQAVSALRASPPIAWQPIETAPRDGGPILGWSNEGVMYVCWSCGWTARDGRWRFFDSGKGETYSFYPTHWMPIPASPEEEL